MNSRCQGRGTAGGRGTGAVPPAERGEWGGVWGGLVREDLAAAGSRGGGRQAGGRAGGGTSGFPSCSTPKAAASLAEPPV